MKVAGIFLIIFGVLIGLYLGVWWAFIGGIIKVVTEIRAPELNAMGLAFGILRIFFAGFVGWISGLCLIIPGVALVSDSR